jgi:hypothetical protein
MNALMNHRGNDRDQHPTGSISSRLVTSLTMAIMLGVVGSRPVLAQKGDSGKDIARGLLKALIESQLERQERENFGPGRPVPPIAVEIQRPNQATPEMQQVRRILTAMTKDSATLSSLISDESRRNPELRKIVPDVISFQATVAATQQRAERENNHLAIQFLVQSLDQKWKPLAHQLATARGVSPAIRDNSQRVDLQNGQLCQILGVREQFNKRELVRAADLLAADLRTLADEAGYEGSGINKGNRLTFRIRRVQEQASLFANLASGGAPLSAVVSEYQSLFQSWQALRLDLDASSARGILRTVSRIQETHRTIHQLLRLEFGLDQALVQRMAEGLDREVTELYRTITLEQIMLLPDSRSLPSVADAFSGTAQNLADVVARRESLEAVGDAWLYLDEQWQLFEFYLKPLRSPDTRRRMEGINQSIEAMKNAIGISVTFDRRAILSQATTVASLADQLQTTVRRWLNRPGQQNVSLNTETQQLTERCRELETLVTFRRTTNGLESVAAKCDAVIVLWEQLRPKLSQCQTDERESIEQTIDSFIPAMIRLRTMLED